MKKTLAICLGCLASMGTWAQGINFIENKTVTEAMAQAKSEGKMLLVSSYDLLSTTSRVMMEHVFTDKEAGEYFNAKAVNLKVKDDSAEGKALAEKYAFSTSPMTLIFSAEGKELFRLAGILDDAEIIRCVKEALAGNGIYDMKARYEAGERDEMFVKEYLKHLKTAGLYADCDKVASEYLYGKEGLILNDGDLTNIFLDYIYSPEASSYGYISTHQEDIPKYSTRIFEIKFEKMWQNYIDEHALTRTPDGYKLDEAVLAGCEVKMKEIKLKSRKDILSRARINAAQKQGDWNLYTTLCTKHFKSALPNDSFMFEAGMRIVENCKDTKLRASAAKAYTFRVRQIEAEEIAAAKGAGTGGMAAARPIYDYKTEFAKMAMKLKE